MTGLANRFDEIRETYGSLCVGIDPSSDALNAWGLQDSAAAALEMGRAIIDAAHELVGIVKPQVAYFERFGAAGFSALEALIAEARSAGLCVVADAKRGDIGTTMSGYADAWLGDGALCSDALTVAPYVGFDALEPVFARAEATESVAFVLCATSNTEARQVQSSHIEAESLPASIARRARNRSGTTRAVGLVVGATRSLADSGLSETDLHGILILAPGFGAQGASLGDISTIFGLAAENVIPSVSRSVIADGPTGVAPAIRTHLRELRA